MMHRTRTPTGDGYINLELPTKPYRILVSGGFDSALLLYLLCNEAKSKLQDTVYVAIVDRGLASVDFAKSVCAWAQAKTDVNIDVTVLTIPKDLHYHYHVMTPASQLHDAGITTISADTQNPPDVTLPGVAPRRIPPNSRFDNWLFPFSGVDKSHTVWLANKHGVLNEISELSHTCTETDGLRCGQCWQCSERAWAFDLLQFKDTGQF